VNLFGKTLRGYWKLRVGDYRVVFKIVDEEGWILGVIHRKKVYDADKEEALNAAPGQFRGATPPPP